MAKSTINFEFEATEHSTCAANELTVGETVALRTVIKEAATANDTSEMRRILARFHVAEAVADEKHRYVGFILGSQTPDNELPLCTEAETVALKKVIKDAANDISCVVSFEMRRMVAKLNAIAAVSPQENRCIGFVVGSQRPENELILCTDEND